MRKAKLTPYSVSPTLQRLFTYGALAAFVLPSIYQIWLILIQLPNNPNISGYYWSLLNMIAAPVLFFILAYLLGDKKKPFASRVFVGTFLATVGMMALITLNLLVNHTVTLFMIAFNDAFWHWFGVELTITGSVVVLYTLLLLTLRRKSGF